MICPISSAGIFGRAGENPALTSREIHHILFGGDKLALLHLAKLIDPAVVGGDQADDLIRGAGLFQGAEFPFISGIPLGFHFHLWLYIAARGFVLRFLEGVEKFAGAFDHLLHGNDRGSLGVFDLFKNTAYSTLQDTLLPSSRSVKSSDLRMRSSSKVMEGSSISSFTPLW